MIKVKNISKSFNDHIALHDISFEVAEGETLILLGTSGSGKTTLLRLINRLILPGAGEILINDKNIASQSPELLRRGIGYVLQGYGLFPHYTVAENIGIVPHLLKWPKEKIKTRVEALLQKLQLPPQQFFHAYPGTLSGGQKQRVGLARALAANPPLLLMDEPFGALDPLTKAEILKLFRHLDELKQKTIVLVTHSVEEAMNLGDKIILLDKGNIIQQGTPIEFLMNPVNDFVQQFFAGQGFQSILQSTLLFDIWTDLEDASFKDPYNLRSNQSLWESLEYLLKNNGQALVYDEETKQSKYIDMEKLRTLYQAPKN